MRRASSRVREDIRPGCGVAGSPSEQHRRESLWKNREMKSEALRRPLRSLSLANEIEMYVKGRIRPGARAKRRRVYVLVFFFFFFAVFSWVSPAKLSGDHSFRGDKRDPVPYGLPRGLRNVSIFWIAEECRPTALGWTDPRDDTVFRKAGDRVAARTVIRIRETNILTIRSPNKNCLRSMEHSLDARSWEVQPWR